MSKTEKITYKGKPYVAMPLAAYEKMVEALEDASDVAVVKEAMAAIASGEEETFPFSMVHSLTCAENAGERITIWRKYRGLDRAALGQLGGVSKNYISQIERGTRTADIYTLQCLAGALNCDVDDLV